MTPAKKLWEDKDQPIEVLPDKKDELVTREVEPVNSRIYAIVKLLIMILLYYVIIIM